MIKFIEKFMKKYVVDIRVSKWNAVKFGAVFSFFIFTPTFIYNKVYDKLSNIDSAIIAIGASIIMGAVWALCSIIYVKNLDKRDIKESEKNKKIIDDRRLKVEMAASGKRVNNKKKKKYRKLLEENNKKDAI
jgi:hypothetical protein